MTELSIHGEVDEATFWLLWWTNAEGKAIVKIGKKGVTMLIKGKEKTFVPDGFAEAWGKYIEEKHRATP